MGAAENKKLIQDMFAELSKGNAQAFPPDGQWQGQAPRCWHQPLGDRHVAEAEA